MQLTKKRFLSIMLSLAVMLSFIPLLGTTVHAAEAKVIGDGVTYQIGDTIILEKTETLWTDDEDPNDWYEEIDQGRYTVSAPDWYGESGQYIVYATNFDTNQLPTTLYLGFGKGLTGNENVVGIKAVASTHEGNPCYKFELVIGAETSYSSYIPRSVDDEKALEDKQVTFNGQKWYLVKDDSTSPTAGTVTLLAADTSFGKSKFNEDGTDINYSSSIVKKQLDALTATGGSFASVADAIIANTDAANGKLYILSAQEATAVSRAALKIDFDEGEDNMWWLRTPDVYGNLYGVYGVEGGLYANNEANKEYGVRPGLKLDLSRVKFDASTKVFTYAPPAPAPTPTPSKNVANVTVNAKTVNAKALENAVKAAGGKVATVKTITLGSKVSKIAAKSFKNFKAAKTLVLKTKKLKKSKVKNSLKGSKITKISVKVGNKKANKKFVKKYKKIFTKKNAGKKVKVS